EVEFIWAASMDQVIAAAIMLDDGQVGSLMEGAVPADTTTPDAGAAEIVPETPPFGDGVAAEAPMADAPAN
ncbi:MAG: hypothetical protein IT337_03965, partial [Thermomicrobiales bacterium]|nr:hypothetical protein [Thermomicrobiales bacterium]